MELRTEDGLHAASLASTESNSYALVGEWLEALAAETRQKGYFLAGQHRAFEIGVKVGQALGHSLVERDAEDGHTLAETYKAFTTLEPKVDKPSKFIGWLHGRLAHLDGLEGLDVESQIAIRSAAGVTFPSDAFDAITRPHIDNYANMRFAKYGAAAVHCTIHAIDTKRRDSILNPSAMSAGHLSLAL